MRRIITTLLTTLAVLLGSMGMSAGADLKKGLVAAKRGDFATALREWTPLVEQGYTSTQYNLGLL